MRKPRIKIDISAMMSKEPNERYSAVLLATADLFVATPSHNEFTCKQFEELSLRLLDKVSIKTRAAMAEIVAQAPELPKSVAMRLAVDDISVAAPILSAYQGFTKIDLLAIIATTGDFHMQVISDRDQLILPSDIAFLEDELDIMHKEDEAKSIIQSDMLTLDDNPSQARLDVEFDRPLSEPETAFTSLSVEGASYYGSRAVRPKQMNVSNLQHFLQLDIDQALMWFSDFAKKEAQQQNQLSPESALHAALQRSEQALSLRSMIDMRDKGGMFEDVARTLRLSEEELLAIIEDDKGLALCVCLRCLSLPDTLAEQALLLINPEHGMSTDTFDLLRWFYYQVNPTVARAAIAEWHGSHTRKARYIPFSARLPLAERNEKDTPAIRFSHAQGNLSAA